MGVTPSSDFYQLICTVCTVFIVCQYRHQKSAHYMVAMGHQFFIALHFVSECMYVQAKKVKNSTKMDKMLEKIVMKHVKSSIIKSIK